MFIESEMSSSRPSCAACAAETEKLKVVVIGVSMSGVVTSISSAIPAGVVETVTRVGTPPGAALGTALV